MLIKAKSKNEQMIFFLIKESLKMYSCGELVWNGLLDPI